MSKLKVESGDKYGQLTILKETDRVLGKSGTSYRVFEVLCECGVVCCTRLSNLRGGTFSCGCLAAKKRRERATHGHCAQGKESRTYKSWASMKERVLNPKSTGYSHYKDRTISDDWVDSFQNFLRDMGERPIGKTLDRVDNTKGYSKENCRWATCREQVKNRECSKKIITHGTLNGYTNHGCRCPPCRAANSSYYRERRKKCVRLD
jgi:hypothetical protein